MCLYTKLDGIFYYNFLGIYMHDVVAGWKNMTDAEFTV